MCLNVLEVFSCPIDCVLMFLKHFMSGVNVFKWFSFHVFFVLLVAFCRILVFLSFWCLASCCFLSFCVLVSLTLSVGVSHVLCLISLCFLWLFFGFSS